MSFAAAEQIANAVLYEGYVLYPYRASAAKNRVRWQFGVVAPRAYSERTDAESWFMQTQCIVLPERRATIDVKVRFLHVGGRLVEEADEAATGFRAVPTLAVDERTIVAWDEGLECEHILPELSLDELLTSEREMPIVVPGASEVEPVSDAAGTIRGRIVRARLPLDALLRIAAAPARPGVRLTVRIENRTPWDGERATTRDDVVWRSLVGTHTLLFVRNGTFVSLIDPPVEAGEAVGACHNLHTWPVLVGSEARRDLILSAPIILYDYPVVAPESPGDLYDATEIDELLTLRVMTMTDREKAEAYATDERARRIVERSDAIPREVFDRLHGAVRYLGEVPPAADSAVPAGISDLALFDSRPGDDRLVIGGAPVTNGTRVRLRPCRRADLMDMFLEGRTAVVTGVFHDVEERAYVAVAIEDDPAADLHRWHGRFFYFHPEEIEPLGDQPTGGPEP